MNTQAESTIHKQVCKYLSMKYPKILFQTDLSGIKLSIGAAKKLKILRSGRAWPDLFLAEPRNGSHGLYIELKADNVTIIKKDGEMVADKHLQEQFKMLCELTKKGYAAHFACGFDQARHIIDNYLK